MASGGYLPLFETKRARGIYIYRVFAVSVFVAICSILVYRVSHVPQEDGRLVWLGLLGAELWFGLYWILSQALRWSPVYRCTFKDRLSKSYENELPGVDIFVCTADPMLEPPMMVISTVLSVMAYDYPPEKLSVYLSDDAGSDLTFYALLEASQFARYWIPYCKKFKVEPRSPAAYFISTPDLDDDDNQGKNFVLLKKLYEDMETRINNVVKHGRVSEELRSKHNGFSHWDSHYSARDHETILQILLDGRDLNAIDIEGCMLPTLVYMAREKRPQYFHNFKAGAMNALIRASSKISNGEIILNVDCDMYSNNSHSVRDALCFFMDKEEGHEFAFVQFPQNFDNLTKNEIYSSSLRVISEVEFHGLDGYGGPLYIGTGCFHRRDTLCGMKFSKEYKHEWKRDNCRKTEEIRYIVGDVKGLVSCTFEENTQWGKEIGLKYGCPVEDVITGLSIQCQGWKSVYFNPERKAFLGVAPTTLHQTLVQHKRWSEGDFQILLSKYSPAWYTLGRIKLGLQMGYCHYCLWAPNCLATLYYSLIPSLYLLQGISLFPQVSSLWFIPFAYVIFASYSYSFAEFLWSGGTIIGWWNDQRIWLYKRTSSYLFAFVDTVLWSFGFSESAFVVSAKVADQDVSQRYEKEVMEFGMSSPMFSILATLALLNLICFGGLVKKVVMDHEGIFKLYDTLALQIILCCVLVLINLPLYQGLLIRTDNGKMPSTLTAKSFVFALLVCSCFTVLYCTLF